MPKDAREKDQGLNWTFCIIEDKLSQKDRDALKPSDFGIPEKEAYPMPDADHVIYAVRFFNSCEPELQADLAKEIVKKARKFKVYGIRVGWTNKLRKYIDFDDPAIQPYFKA